MSLVTLPAKEEERTNFFMMDRNELTQFISEDKTFPEVFNYRILLALPILEEKTRGGILLSGITKELGMTGNCIGRVVGVGSTAGVRSDYKDSSTLEIGDYVTYNPHVGRPYSYNGSEFLFVSDQNIDGRVFDPRFHTDKIFQSFDIKGLTL